MYLSLIDCLWNKKLTTQHSEEGSKKGMTTNVIALYSEVVSVTDISSFLVITT